jgi:hypothetical protein
MSNNASLLEGFPEKFRTHQRFDRLEEVTAKIYGHPAVNLERPEALDNMVRASLLFTVCFYGNLLGCLRGYLSAALPKHPFAVQEDGTFLHLLLSLADEELSTGNIPMKRTTIGPHYVAMLEAAQAAGINTEPVETLVRNARSHAFGNRDGEIRMNLRTVMQETGFHRSCIEYMLLSEQCAEIYHSALSTVGLRELSLSPAFEKLQLRIPADSKYEGYKIFLQKHIELDSGSNSACEIGNYENSHGHIMAQALALIPNVGDSINAMVRFYQARLAVYDACLAFAPIF